MGKSSHWSAYGRMGSMVTHSSVGNVKCRPYLSGEFPKHTAAQPRVQPIGAKCAPTADADRLVALSHPANRSNLN